MGCFHPALPDVVEDAIADAHPLSTQFGADFDPVPFYVSHGKVRHQGAIAIAYADSLTVARLGEIENDFPSIP